jgi:hypothetical protein
MQAAIAAAALGDRGHAVREARAALASFSALGAQPDTDAGLVFLDHLP